jgi:nucleoside-diphosphate-sugar epimerase
MSFIVVTGANGFIGSLLLTRLEALGHQVRGLVRTHSDLSLIPSRLHDHVLRTDYETDLRAALGGAEAVIHLAAVTKARGWEDYRRQNVELTAKLVNTVNATPTVGRFLFLSSQSAAGVQSGRLPVREDDPCRPRSDYGRSKLEAENLVRERCKPPWTILRPVSVYGPGDKDFLPYFRLANRGFSVLAGSNDRCLNLIHAYDLVDLIAASLFHPDAANQVFFASDGHIYRMEDFVTAIRHALSTQLRVLRIPFWTMYPITALSEGYARLTGGKTPVLNASRLRDFSGIRWVCDGSKAVRMLDFTPQYTLQRGIGETVRWYRENHWL